jgi:hypothetical protein
MADNLKMKGAPDRSHINVHESWEVKYWTKHLGVSEERLRAAVEKVGNAVATVKKELAV